jgi:hypothetical protein
MKTSDALLEAAEAQHDTTVAQILTIIAETFKKLEDAALEKADNPSA